MQPARLLRRATGVAAVAVVSTASGALAHPFITDGATVRAASLTTMTLEMGHGCGDEAGGGSDPTLEVAMEVPGEVSYIEPLDTDGYEASVEADADGRPEVVTWTATDGGVAAPAVPMDLVIDGEEGDELFLKVFQGCEDFEYRWVGTPDDPADNPAVALTLGPPDPEAPPAPSPEPPTADDGVDEGNDEGADEADDEAAAPAAPPGSESNDGQPTEDSPDTTGAGQPAVTEDQATAPWIGVGLIALLVLAALLEFRRRQRNARAGTSDPVE